MNKHRTVNTPTHNIELTLTENDKLVVVGNAQFETVQQLVIDFTRSYDDFSDSGIKPISKIHKVDDSKTAITFPYDIDFEILCYYVNHLKYGVEITHYPTILAWTSSKSSYCWLNESFENNKMIMFIDPNDTEYDNVMITTFNGKPYKVRFGMGYGLQEGLNIIQPYVQPPLNLVELSKHESIEVR